MLFCSFFIIYHLSLLHSSHPEFCVCCVKLVALGGSFSLACFFWKISTLLKMVLPLGKWEFPSCLSGGFLATWRFACSKKAKLEKRFVDSQLAGWKSLFPLSGHLCLEILLKKKPVLFYLLPESGQYVCGCIKSWMFSVEVNFHSPESFTCKWLLTTVFLPSYSEDVV